MQLSFKHLVSGAECSAEDIKQLLDLAVAIKSNPQAYQDALYGKHLALLFSKPSLRTRFSFTVGMHQLGGEIVESIADSRKTELPRDQMRVIQGYCQGVMVRTHEEQELEAMIAEATIPVINGLSKLYHPCQTLADLLTLQEVFGQLEGLQVCYLGDGNNILHSLLLMASKVGVKVNYCCPPGHHPAAEVLAQVSQHLSINAFTNPTEAVKGCDAVYTDVWSSMGFEAQNETAFAGYQVNEALMDKAKSGAIFLHCMPMERGKEVSQTLPDAPCSAIFLQSANRLYAQKALLLGLLTQQ